MEIQEIKQRLSILAVLGKYNLKPDKNSLIKCPFHEDKSPSLKIYTNTNTFNCFGCGANGDSIQFIEQYEKVNKHQAILKAQSFVGVPTVVNPQPKPDKPTEPPQTLEERTRILTKIFESFRNGLRNAMSVKPKEYLKNRNLNHESLELGYNSGQFHHRGQLSETDKQACINAGLLIPYNGSTPNASGATYTPFAKDCIIFPLRNQQNQTVSLYGRSILESVNGTGKHFYLKDRAGLYPSYPKPSTTKLILTEAIIDAATLLQVPEIKAEYEVLSCYGTNGLTEEHKGAIKELQNLEEIIFFFDGDKAGREAIKKYQEELSGLLPNVKLAAVETPEKEDVNSLSIGHEPEIFTHLLASRKELFLLAENPSAKKEKPNPANPLNTSNPSKLIYETPELRFTIWGGIEKDNLHRLKVNLLVEPATDSFRYYQDDVNLYSNAQLQRFIKGVAEELETSSTIVKNTLKELSAQLAEYRLKLGEDERKALQPKLYQMTKEEEREATTFLKSKNLVGNTLKAVERSGLVGEQKNALLLFFLYLSRLTDEPLHAIIFGKSGSGKTYLQTRVSECLPEESLRTITSLTENTLYYSAKDFWKHKVLLIEDLEGVYNAFLPLREFMSKQSITKLTTDKDAKGNNVQKLLLVEGPICVSGATTQESIYEDNANRSFLLIIDESQSHLNEVMGYQRKQQAGLINEAEQEKAKQLLKNTQRLLRGIKIINPYAPQLEIPQCVFKKLRTNMHYLKLIEIITFYHQKQREIKTDRNGKPYIETAIEDIECANDLVKETLLRKSDELNGELRGFFERLKNNLSAKQEQSFYSKGIREQFRLNPMRVNRYLRDLESRGYIGRNGGNRKLGFEYEITAWNEYEKLKSGVNILDEILQKLKEKAV